MSVARPTQEQITASLRILESRNATRQEKQQAFDTVKQSFCPVINLTPEYAAELDRVFALRFPPWPASPPNNVVGNPQLLADRIRGLIFGNALGDAVGISTEFMNRLQVAQNYPPNHVFRPAAPVHTDFHRLKFCQGDWVRSQLMISVCVCVCVCP